MSNARLDFLTGGGETGTLIRAYDWASSALGSPHAWPQSLKTVVRLLLNTCHPMFIFWGESLTFFYNDAYLKYIGHEHHPLALGRPGNEVYAEIWTTLGPKIEHVMSGQEVSSHEDHRSPFSSNGQHETACWNYSFSPLDDSHASTGVGGVLAVCIETTQTMLATKRYHFFTELGDQLRTLSTPQEVMARAATMLGEYLNVSCVGYAEVENSGEYVLVERDWISQNGVSAIGRHRIEDYGQPLLAKLHAGLTVQVDDINTSLLLSQENIKKAYEPIKTQSFIDVPIIKKTRLVGILFVLNAQPRTWKNEEVIIVEEVAERTWDAVERGRVETALRLADRRKDEFLAMLAHELRNPLAPIGAAADLLKLAQFDEERVKQTSEIISRQVKHMTSLIDDLLDVSRVTRGLVTLDKVVIDAKRIVLDAVEQVRPLAEARGHDLELHIAAEPAFILGDQKRLVQVIANLLNNAAKYTPPGGNITLKIEVSETHVTFFVTDNGIGMTPELVARAFELFEQAERTADRSQGGLGIGLALVKSLIELHEGTVTAYSKGISFGSEFSVRLPRHIILLNATNELQSGITLPSTSEGLHLMVVDDNVNAARMLAMFLETAGHQVFVEYESKKALERALIEVPDACLLDIGLPEMDGNELARHLRSDPRTAHALLIAVTGYGQEQDRKKAALAGFDHYLVKPVDTKALFTLLAEFTPPRSTSLMS